MTTTKDYISWFSNSIGNTSVQRDPLVGDSMDWKGLGLSLAKPTFTAIKGAKTALDVNKAYNATSSLSGLGKVATTANTASKAAVAGKGALSALGGTVGVGNLALTAASFLPGAKQADYSTGVEKAAAVGSTAAGLGATLGIGAAALGPIGLGLGALVLASNLFGKTAKKHEVSAADTLQYSGSGYGNLNQDIAAAGKKFSMFRRSDAKKVNRRIDDIDRDRVLAGTIGFQNRQNTLAGINTIGDIDSKNLQSLQGGYTTNILAAKQGAKLAKFRNIKKKVNIRKKSIEKPIEKFENGGKVNVIPDGALHARKHNIDQFGDNITKKGIPVISGDLNETIDGTLELQKGGEITQHAEVEREEIILHKELTSQLEKLLKSYEKGDEEALIEAGKLLTYEILENTADNTGLINKV